MKNKKILATTILGCSFFQICPNVISNLGIHQVLANETDKLENIKKPKNLIDFFENYNINLAKDDKNIIDVRLLEKHFFEEIFNFYNQKGISNKDMQNILCGYEKRPNLNNSEKEKITDITMDYIKKIRNKDKYYNSEKLININDFLTFCNNNIPYKKIKLNQLQHEFTSKGFSYDEKPDPNLNSELQHEYRSKVQRLQMEGLQKYQKLAKEQGKKTDISPFLACDVKINENDYKFFSNIYNQIMILLKKGNLTFNNAGYFIPVFKNNLIHNIVEKYSEKGDEIYDTIDVKPPKPGEMPKPPQYHKPGDPIPTTIKEYNDFLLFRQHNEICNNLNKYIQKIAEKNNLNMAKFFMGDIEKGEVKLTKEEEDKINEYINNLRILESISDNKINIPATTTMWRLSSLKGELLDNNDKQPGRYEMGIKFTKKPDESYKVFSDKFDKICGEKQNEIMEIFKRNNVELEDILDGDLTIVPVCFNDDDYKKLCEMERKNQNLFNLFTSLENNFYPPFEYTETDKSFMDKRGKNILEFFYKELSWVTDFIHQEPYDRNILFSMGGGIHCDDIIEPKPDGNLEDTKPGKPELGQDDSDKEKPGQDKPEQDKPGQDDSDKEKPGQDKPEQDKPGQDDSDKEKPGQDKPEQDKPGQDDSDKEKPGQDKPEQDKPGQDKPEQQKPEEKPEQQKPEEKPEEKPEQKPEQDKPSQDETDKEKPEQEKPGQDKPEQDKSGQDETDKEKPSQEKPEQEKPGQEKPGQEKPGQEKPSQDEIDKEKPGQEKPEQDKPSQDKLSSDKSDKDESIKDEKEENKHNQVKHDSKNKESNKFESKDSENSDSTHSESTIIDNSLKDKLSNEAKDIIVKNKLGKDKQEIIAKVPEKQQAKVADLIKTAENNHNISNMLIVTFITGLSIAGFALFKKFKKE